MAVNPCRAASMSLLPQALGVNTQFLRVCVQSAHALSACGCACCWTAVFNGKACLSRFSRGRHGLAARRHEGTGTILGPEYPFCRRDRERRGRVKRAASGLHAHSRTASCAAGQARGRAADPPTGALRVGSGERPPSADAPPVLERTVLRMGSKIRETAACCV